MKVIPPITITDALLTSSTVAEPSAGETAWNSATSYTLGTEVIRTATHRKYINLIPGVDATNPESAPTRWQDSGPTNKWAMFDLYSSNRSTATTSMVVSVAPGQRVNGVALIGLVGSSAQISMTVAAVEVWNSGAINLTLRNTLTATQYAFGKFGQKKAIARFDMPPYSSATITVTITGPVVGCSALVIGSYFDMGRVISGVDAAALNFSTIDRATTGELSKMIPRRTVARPSMTVLGTATSTDALLDLREELNAKPAVWSGMDDQDTSPYFNALLILGPYKEFSPKLNGNGLVETSLQLEEI